MCLLIFILLSDLRSFGRRVRVVLTALDIRCSSRRAVARDLRGAAGLPYQNLSAVQFCDLPILAQGVKHHLRFTVISGSAMSVSSEPGLLLCDPGDALSAPAAVSRGWWPSSAASRWGIVDAAVGFRGLIFGDRHPRPLRWLCFTSSATPPRRHTRRALWRSPLTARSILRSPRPRRSRAGVDAWRRRVPEKLPSAWRLQAVREDASAPRWPVSMLWQMRVKCVACVPLCAVSPAASMLGIFVF